MAMKLRWSHLVVLFAIGAVVSPVGDHMHVVTGTTAYDKEFAPFVWLVPITFPISVGLATAALGFLRTRLAPARTWVQPRHGLLGVAAVMLAYAISASVHASQVVAVTMISAVAAATWAFLGDRASTICGVVAAVGGPLVEIAMAEAGLFHYAPGIDGLLGVAVWLVPLYFCFGVVAGCLAEGLVNRADSGASAALAHETRREVAPSR